MAVEVPPRTPVNPSNERRKLFDLLRGGHLADQRSAALRERLLSESQSERQASPKEESRGFAWAERREPWRSDATAKTKGPNNVRTVKIVSALLMVDGVIACVASSAEYGGGANVSSVTGGVMLLSGFVGFIAGRLMK